jgi:hypothetical protein
MGRGGLLRSWVSRNLPIPLAQGGDEVVSQGCHGLAEPEAVDDMHVRCWRKILRGAADQYATFDPISRRLCHGKDVCNRVHGTGISATYGLGPLGFQQHQVPSTRPEKIDLTVLLIAIKKQRGPGMIELRYNPQKASAPAWFCPSDGPRSTREPENAVPGL